MNAIKIDVSARVIGRNWMPGCLCWKDVRATFTPDDRPFSHQWSNLRDALLRLANDGDFQSAALSDVWLTIDRLATRGILRTYHKVNMDAIAVADLIADPDDVEACWIAESDRLN